MMPALVSRLQELTKKEKELAAAKAQMREQEREFKRQSMMLENALELERQNAAHNLELAKLQMVCCRCRRNFFHALHHAREGWRL